MSETDLFWLTDTNSYDVVTRRVLFSYGKKLGEIVISIAPDQPVVDLTTMSEAVQHESIIESEKLTAHQTITPQLVFSAVSAPHQGSAPVVTTASHRELPIWHLAYKTDHTIDDMSFQTAMKRAHAAMPTAAVAAGDYAVGFLVRDEVLHFYPLLAVTLPEDIASCKDGSGSTNDVIPLLPFQS